MDIGQWDGPAVLLPEAYSRDHTTLGRYGSITEVAAPNFDFRFTPESGHNSDITPCLKRATNRNRLTRVVIGSFA